MEKKLNQLWEAQSRKLLSEEQTTGGKHRGTPRLHDFYLQELYSVSKWVSEKPPFMFWAVAEEEQQLENVRVFHSQMDGLLWQMIFFQSEILEFHQSLVN